MDKKILFNKGKWIWENNCAKCDEYAQFKVDFSCDKEKKHFLSISVDSNYAVFIHDELVTFGQYHDYPYYKVGDKIDISSFVCDGENEMIIVVWYYGKSNMTYTVGKAGLLFEILEEDAVIAYSSTKTLSKPAYGYVQHKCKDITSQLGFTYEYDANDTIKEYTKSCEVLGITYDINERPIKKLTLENRSSFEKVFAGTYRFPNERESLPLDMQKASLSFLRADREDGKNKPFKLISDNGDNLYFIVDLEREECGFLDFDIDVKETCDIYIAFGEHLVDGRIRTHKRNFTCIYHAKSGNNKYTNPFRRFGCRYLEVFAETKEIQVNYFGVRPTNYPLNIKKPNTGNLLRDTIYNTAERTLLLCMHEHYEDCPWREQALYTMDSRNQMLFGYFAFFEYDFPRASLKLISKGVRKKDGLLTICFPSDNPLTIPSFSLMYFVEMWEYIKYTNDISLASEVYDVLQKVISSFISRIQDNGLYISHSGGDNEYWDFFEWSETMVGDIKGEKESIFKCAGNAYLSYALQHMSKISSALGRREDSEKYANLSKMINKSIIKNFWNEKDKLFASFIGDDTYSVLVNSMCTLCMDDGEFEKTNVEKIIIANGSGDAGKRVIPITLSMHVFRYDALLKLDKDNSKFVLDDIDRTYLYMLTKGATTFWETIKGERDFDWVGSLCHGWSALPIYYYETLRDGDK